MPSELIHKSIKLAPRGALKLMFSLIAFEPLGLSAQSPHEALETAPKASEKAKVDRFADSKEHSKDVGTVTKEAHEKGWRENGKGIASADANKTEIGYSLPSPIPPPPRRTEVNKERVKEQ